MQTTDDAVLIQQCSDGDSAAFAQLVSRYQRPVYQLCWRYLRGQEAEDAAQETFVRAFLNRAELDPQRPILPWLVTVARRLCLDRLRQQKRQPVGMAGDAAESASGLVDPSITADRAIERHQQQQQLASALAQLPDSQREAMMLFYVEGMPYAQISDSLQVPIGTVMTWLHRGRFAVKAAMKAQQMTIKNHMNDMTGVCDASYR